MPFSAFQRSSPTFRLIVLRRDTYCVLISFSPKEQRATYFDPGSKWKTKKYHHLKCVMNDALAGYVAKGGPIDKKWCKNKKIGVFTHQCQFPGVKQPKNNAKDAYYALLMMRAYIRGQNNLRLPSDIRPWAEALATKYEEDVSEEFYRIQEEFCDILHQDVCMSGGIFYGGNTPTNVEVERRLIMQGDHRPFMTKDGILPFPEPTQKY